MGFTVAPAGAPAPRYRKAPRVPLAPLKPSPCRWYRETEDGEWAFERLEDSGTTWVVTRLPMKTVACGYLGSLRQCRAYVASGEAQEDLDRIATQRKGAAA